MGLQKLNPIWIKNHTEPCSGDAFMIFSCWCRSELCRGALPECQTPNVSSSHLTPSADVVPAGDQQHDMVIHPCGNRPRTEATNKQRTNPPLNPGRAGTTTPNPSQRSASFLKSLFSSGASSSSSSSKFPACQWSAQLPYHVAHCVKENLIIYPLGVSWEVWNCGCCAVFYVVPGFFGGANAKNAQETVPQHDAMQHQGLDG